MRIEPLANQTHQQSKLWSSSDWCVLALLLVLLKFTSQPVQAVFMNEFKLRVYFTAEYSQVKTSPWRASAAAAVEWPSSRKAKTPLTAAFLPAQLFLFRKGKRADLMALSILINLLACVGVAAVVFVFWVLVSSGRPSFLRKPGRVALTGRGIVVTGAGGGLGQLIALELCRRKGLQVGLLVLLDIDPVALALTKKTVEMLGGPRVQTYQCDVSEAEQVCSVLKQARQEAAPLRLSVVINNAGIVGGRGQVCFDVSGACILWMEFFACLRSRVIVLPVKHTFKFPWSSTNCNFHVWAHI
jgi:hypothetical protein